MRLPAKPLTVAAGGAHTALESAVTTFPAVSTALTNAQTALGL